MAAFLTHLVVGERVWARGKDRWQSAGGDGYGTFLFGCLAPDVDKFCPGLEQGTTHFLPKDREGNHLWKRCARFLAQPQEFLRAPLGRLRDEERVFVLGYLCHVATDEITARHARTIRRRHEAAGEHLPNVDAIMTAMDPRLWTMAGAPQAAAEALAAANIPDGTFTFAPPECLAALHQVVLPQVFEGGGLLPYLATVRRQWQWLRHGLVSDSPDDPLLEADLAAYRCRIEQDLRAAEQLVAGLEFGEFIAQAVSHSAKCIAALLAEETGCEPIQV